MQCCVIVYVISIVTVLTLAVFVIVIIILFTYTHDYDISGDNDGYCFNQTVQCFKSGRDSWSCHFNQWLKISPYAEGKHSTHKLLSVPLLDQMPSNCCVVCLLQRNWRNVCTRHSKQS